MPQDISNQGFLLDDGTPNLKLLTETFNRCAPAVSGGTQWMENVRFCRWPGQNPDGRKHDDPHNPHGAALPWNGASDSRPFTVDDVIGERVDMLNASFWRAMIQQMGAGGDSDEATYAAALVEHLMFVKFPQMFLDEVELAANYQETYGWCLLAPRWKRELGIKRLRLTMDMINSVAQQAQQATSVAANGAAAPGGMGAQPQPPQGAAPGGDDSQATVPGQAQADQQVSPTGPGGAAVSDPAQGQADQQVSPTGAAGPAMPSPTMPGIGGMPDLDPLLVQLAQLPQLITDPSLEEQAVAALQAWYDSYVADSIPDDLKAKVPKTTPALARKVVRALRQGDEGTAPLPYLAKNEPVVSALKPWDEAFLPPELTTTNEIVFQVERITDAELKGRELTQDYDPEWVKQALTKKGQWSSPLLPVGTPLGLQGNLGGGVVAVQTPGTASLDGKTGPIEIIYAVYRAADSDGIPGIYCTTFHRAIAADAKGEPLYALHEPVEGPDDGLPYTACTREKWARSIASSRGVPEMAYTQQNLVKGFEDGMADRASITGMPPVNVYESPLETEYEFGPARKNYCRPGREPKFMQMPAGEGMQEMVECRTMVKNGVENRFGLLSQDVSTVRQQTKQERSVRRFLMSWTTAIKQMTALYQVHGDDAEFADITGAPAGWLEQRRLQPGLLSCSLDFDVRELDPELMMKRIEAMNKVALPNDVLGVIQRGQWASFMARSIMGPAAAKRLVQPMDDASQALMNKAKNEVLQMFAGNPPNFVDDKDPTAPSLLQYTKQIVTTNPTYLRALNDAAFVAVAGQAAPQLIQQIGHRHPDDRFSGLLVQWLKNLQFVGVTQVQNKQIGRLGVDPGQAGQ